MIVNKDRSKNQADGIWRPERRKYENQSHEVQCSQGQEVKAFTHRQNTDNEVPRRRSLQMLQVMPVAGASVTPKPLNYFNSPDKEINK